MSSPKRADLVESLKVLKSARKNAVVITAMGTAREWMALGNPHPLDFVFVPSSMGQATSLGLGMALAEPSRRIIICNGDGSTLMNLGALVTITALAPKNLTLVVFDNEVYEITGAQSTPGSARRRQDETAVDFARIARSCGFRSVFEFDDAKNWRDAVDTVLDDRGPTFVLIKVAPVPGAEGPKSPSPAKERALNFRNAFADGLSPRSAGSTRRGHR